MLFTLEELHELTKSYQNELEPFFENSEYRPVVSMVRKDGAYDHGALMFALGKMPKIPDGPVVFMPSNPPAVR